MTRVDIDSDGPANDGAATDADVVELAEAYLAAHPLPENPELRASVERELADLESERSSLEPGDPLVEVLDAEIEEKRRRFADVLRDDGEVRERLLAAVSASFVPDGDWLHPAVLNALNHVLRHRVGDELVVERRRLTPDSDVPADEAFEVAMAVREAAAAELRATTRLADRLADREE